MARPVNQAARDAQRRAILDAAGQLFVERGFHQTGIAAICKAVGMSPGALYRYFGSKTEIIEAIVALERAEALTLLDAVASADDLRDGLAAMLLACWEGSSDRAAVALSLEVAAEGSRSDTVRSMVDETYRAFTRRLAELIRAAQDRGAVAPTVDAAAVAAVLAATADGLAVAGESEDASAEALRISLEAMVHGLLGPRPR